MRLRRCWLLVISDDSRVEWLTLFKSLTVCGVKLVLHGQGDACWIAWKIVVSKVPLQHQQLHHVNVTCCMWSWQEKEECLFIVGVIQGSCKDARWLRWRWTERKVVFASCNAAVLSVLVWGKSDLIPWWYCSVNHFYICDSSPTILKLPLLSKTCSDALNFFTWNKSEDIIFLKSEHVLKI